MFELSKVRTLTKTELVLSFAASCVESVARALNLSYDEVYDKMKRAQLFERLIFPHYETMHTESREAVTQRLIEILQCD